MSGIVDGVGANDNNEQAPTTINRKPRRQVVPRQRVTRACQACRQRRAKCDGQTPCERCARLQLDCNYREDPDGRSKAAAKRKHGDMQQDQDLLYSLLGTIRDSSDTEVSQIVALIRSGARVDEVRSAIRMQTSELSDSGREPSPELTTLRTRLNDLTDSNTSDERARSRQNVPQVQRMVESPPFHVPASPWTAVSDDAELVSHLMSLWIYWDKPFNNFVNSDLLLVDMKNGRKKCHYCSPFLVNSILAWACLISDYEEAKPIRGVAPKMMTDFITEAKVHMEAEMVTGLTIPVVQGLAFLFLAASSTLQDSAVQYLLQATDMAQSLGQLPIPASIANDASEVKKFSETVDLTCWGVFNLITSIYVVFQRPQYMKIPVRPKPVINDPVMQKPAAPMNQAQSTASMASFETMLMSMICNDSVHASKLTQLLFDSEKRECTSRSELEVNVLELYHLIMSQSRQKDTLFKLEENSPRCLYGYRIKVLVITLAMLLFLKQPADGASSEVQRMAQDWSLTSALELARICEMYMHHYGTRRMTAVFTQCASIALYVLFEQPDTSIYHDQITCLCICLRAISRRTLTGMAILRMVQLEAKKQGAVLPAATDKLLHDFEKDSWSQRQPQSMISEYPSADNLTFRKKDAPDMGKFLEQMDNLEITSVDPDPRMDSVDTDSDSSEK